MTTKFTGFVYVVLSCVSWLSVGQASASAQSRVGILQAEDRRAATAADLATLRAGARAGDAQTRRMAVRALGRLERPSIIPEIVPALRNALPEIRAEAANAIAQAAQGWRADRSPSDARALTSALGTLIARRRVDEDAEVRAAICESVGRLPYRTEADVSQAERALVDAAGSATTITDRLGVAKGLEALTRGAQKIAPPGAETIALLRRLVVASPADVGASRIRRLAFDALVTAKVVDADTIRAAASDPDAQVRRAAVRAAALAGHDAAEGDIVHAALTDTSPMVRYEALRGVADDCDAATAATRDGDMHVVLLAFFRLSACGGLPDAAALLERTIDDLSDAASPRGWQRAAHALVALAAAHPERAAATMPGFTGSRIWQVRMYAARAAAVLKDRATLEKLASADADDNVREAAIDALAKIAGHDADLIYADTLTRSGYQVIRAAALALVDSPHSEVARPALEAALQRLVREGHDNSHDARAAISKALGKSDSEVRLASQTSRSDSQVRLKLSNEELRRLASPRARIAIMGVGTFELALFPSVAPLTVLEFVHLAESGYYNGLTFHRVVPNFVIQGGSPGANEYIGEPTFMRDEVSLWPHVRGAVGISTRGHDTGDAQIFIDLVDNPRLDHVYTVFAQVLNGMDVVDRILEGDVIERVEIIP